ncbi:MAG: M28 family peptidase [Pseudomonadota bacterium]|nr:M28 family peptidase [Pseudomonadota bacterium]
MIASRINQTPTGRRGWAGLAIWFAVLASLSLAGFIYSFHMPRKTHSRPLPRLRAEQHRIRDRVSAHVSMLAGTIGERNLWHYQALVSAADYLEQTFVELGYRPTNEPFESRGQTVRNIFAEKRGTSNPEEIVLVGAHYDSVLGSPGANDNGSGVAALLELARLLAEWELPRTVRFVAFVNEEPPFSYTAEMGSLVHAPGQERAAKTSRPCYPWRPSVTIPTSPAVSRIRFRCVGSTRIPSTSLVLSET